MSTPARTPFPPRLKPAQRRRCPPSGPRLPAERQHQLRDLLGQLLARFHEAKRLKEGGHE